MATEIERKFLVVGDAWKKHASRSERYRQGYLAVNEQCGIRVRVAGYSAALNVKSAGLDICRQEFEYSIPVADAEAMLDELCGGKELSKTRHFIRHGAHTWEVDEFDGANAGLVVAEIELQAEDEVFERPDWLGKEVSGDERYLNSSLVLRPYGLWR